MLNRAILIVLIAVVITACGASDSETISLEDIQATIANLPEGDSTSGEELFTQRIGSAPACSGCHQINEGRGVGPGLAGYADYAGDIVEGQDAFDYTYLSIAYPATHIVDTYANEMYTGYENALSDQEMADIIAYLLSLS